MAYQVGVGDHAKVVKSCSMPVAQWVGVEWIRR